MSKNTVRIPAVIERYRWQNDEESWGVSQGVRVDNGEAITLIGPVCGRLGTPHTYVGSWKEHDQFGMQLEVTHIGVAENLSNEAVARVIEHSHAFMGFGPVAIKKLLGAASDQGLAHDMVSDIDGLVERSGIRRKLLEIAGEAWIELLSSGEDELFLTAYGLTQKQIAAMRKMYGESVIGRVQADPYMLVRGFRSLTFARVDMIAREQGVEDHDPRRIRACVIESFHVIRNNGHTLADPNTIFRNCMDLIGTGLSGKVERELVTKFLDELRDAGVLTSMEIAPGQYAAGLSDLLMGERSIMLLAVESYLVATLDCPELVDIEAEYGLSLEVFADILGHEPTPEQYAAGRVAATYPMMFLVGGAGVGKTFTIRIIQEVFRRMDLEIMQAAPTGKAAKRMTDTTDFDSSTLHRLMQLIPTDDSSASSIVLQNEETAVPPVLGLLRANNRAASACTIDEASMLDSYLGGQVGSKMQACRRLVFVFDDAQLPPVGAGSPILDLKELGVVPTVTLSQTHRNTGELYQGIQGVRNGVIYPTANPDSPFILNNTADADAIVRAAMQFYTDHVHGQFSNGQIIAPMKKGVAGVYNLNAACQWQRLVNEGKDPLPYPAEKETLVVGDKVMGTKNFYEGEGDNKKIKIQNGAIGVLLEIELNDKGKVEAYLVELEGNGDEREQVALRGRQETASLTLGYCITVHKSQGSEWPHLLYAHPSGGAPGFLDRRMLYTAVSRAQKSLNAYGSMQAIQKSAALARGSERMTSVTPHVFYKLAQEVQSARLEDEIRKEVELANGGATDDFDDVSFDGPGQAQPARTLDMDGQSL